MTQRRSKRYSEIAKTIERGEEHAPAAAVKMVKAAANAKFDETVELHLRMGVDPKHADQIVRGAAVLPHGTDEGSNPGHHVVTDRHSHPCHARIPAALAVPPRTPGAQERGMTPPRFLSRLPRSGEDTPSRSLYRPPGAATGRSCLHAGVSAPAARVF